MSTLEVLVAALMLGLVTLPHCLVMCGPVASSACADKRAALPYLAGRLVGYATVGSLMGTLGAHAFVQLGADNVGRVALVVLAASCLWQAYRVLRPTREKLVTLGGGRDRSSMKSSIFALLGTLLPKKGLGLGLATAVFPCGALPAAWAVAASSGHALTGALAMLAFATASMPALVIAVGGRQLLQRVAHRIPQKVQAGAWILIATALVARAWLIEASCHG